MIAKTDTTEDTGECYGCNLIYSGNHYEAAEVSGYGKMRLTAGINPQSFFLAAGSGENFAAPEAVMAYSCEGLQWHEPVHACICAGAHRAWSV